MRITPEEARELAQSLETAAMHANEAGGESRVVLPKAIGAEDLIVTTLPDGCFAEETVNT